MIARLATWVWLVLAGLSRYFVNTWIAGLWWALTGRGAEPNPGKTFSSRVGRNALQGDRWAIWMEGVIDGLFWPGHCRASIEENEV